jgi:arylsulfatase A-like enzyme
MTMRPSRRDLIKAAAAAPAGLLARTAARPNILLIVSDDQRPDTISALGNKVIRTPNLDSLVRGGVAFTRATCANPICTPSRAEIMTGASGFRNGILDFGGRIAPDCALWAETMRRAGYRTWYVGKWHNDGRALDRGYQEVQGLFAGGGSRWAVDRTDFKGRPVTGYRGWIFQTGDGRMQPELGVGLTADISSRFADSAIGFLRRKSDSPFFLHVNFTAPHDPLIMPPGYEAAYPPEEMPLPVNFLPEHPFDHGNLRDRDEQLLPWPRTAADVREELACYYAVVSHMDREIGRILDALKATGQDDNTLVIFTSDNGLAIGSHGLRGKQNMYEHTIGVPLILRGPGISADRRSKAQCYLRDLFPTACELAGIPIPASVEGRSLAPLLDGRSNSLYPEVFGYFRNVQRMIRTERWKLIHYPEIGRYQLFDSVNDRDELRDLSSDPKRASVRSDLRRRLEAWQVRSGDPLRAQRNG